jgi:hypothetical protein
MNIPLKTHLRIVLSVSVCVIAAMFIYMSVAGPAHPDEVEHAHVSWLVSAGERPYLDFYQPHMPFLWFVSALLIKNAPHSITVLLGLRILCIIAFSVSAFIGYKALKLLITDTKKTCSVSCSRDSASRHQSPDVLESRSYLFFYLTCVLSAGLASEMFRFRPDPFMSLAVMAGIYFSMRISNRDTLNALFAGIAFGIAFIISPKMVCLLFLVPIQAIFCKTARLPVRAFKSFFAYFLGVIAGLLPLIIYLIFSASRSRCVDCVFGSYLRWIGVPEIEWGFVPGSLWMIIAMLASVGAMLAIAIRRMRHGNKDMVPMPVALTIAVFLSTTPTMLNYNHAEYNLQSAVVPFGVLAAYLFQAVSCRFNQKTGMSIYAIILPAAAVFAAGWAAITDIRRPEQAQIRDLTLLNAFVERYNLSHQLLIPFYPIFSSSIAPDFSPLYINGASMSAIADAILSHRPDLVFTQNYWELWRQNKYVDVRTQWKIQSFLDENYTEVNIGRCKILVINNKKALLAGL